MSMKYRKFVFLGITILLVSIVFGMSMKEGVENQNSTTITPVQTQVLTTGMQPAGIQQEASVAQTRKLNKELNEQLQKIKNDIKKLNDTINPPTTSKK